MTQTPSPAAAPALGLRDGARLPVRPGGAPARRAGALRRQLRRGPIRLALTLLVLIEVAPLAWLLLSSLKADAEFSSRPMWALPLGIHYQNYVDAWTTGDIGIYFRNSALATFPALAMIIILSVAAGFALEIMGWRGRDGVLLMFVAGLLVPLQMVLLPLFTIYFKVDLINTLWSLIITYTAFGLPLSVFLMAGYYKAVPRELFEAAAIDGAGIYRAFWKISLPMMRNAIVTVALVQFFFIWNDLLLSLTFISSNNLRTIQTGLLNFVGQYGQVQWGPTFASVCMAVFPTLAVYLVLNQRVMKGLTAGSLKG
jgi:raffinose/stachyose/melibiose transport system permease protein